MLVPWPSIQHDKHTSKNIMLYLSLPMGLKCPLKAPVLKTLSLGCAGRQWKLWEVGLVKCPQILRSATEGVRATLSISFSATRGRYCCTVLFCLKVLLQNKPTKIQIHQENKHCEGRRKGGEDSYAHTQTPHRECNNDVLKICTNKKRKEKWNFQYCVLN